jgi:threonine-phosphate decarboxylase
MIEGHGDDIYRYGALRCNFSSNISPLIDTSGLRQYLAERQEVICHYPEPSAHSLEVLLAKEYDITSEEVLVTSGATDAIYLVAQTLRDEGTFAVKRPTFSEYADACRIFGYQEAPKGGAVRWLCNPNNPTGEVCPLEKIQHLSRRHHWLVIDQSYEDCTTGRMLSPVEAIEMRNVIQIHSMTKRFDIPGLRLGYITAPASVISRLRANCRPWAVNALAIEAGKWLLTHKDSNQRYMMDDSLEILGAQLSKEAFFRISRSVIIAADTVESVTKLPGGRMSLTPAPGIKAYTDLSVSRSRADDFMSWLA